ncbi:Flp pilus assembly protein TadD [Comamonas sp. BIGb0152]|uniref:TssQ family T6SS-associated lipoprotein n=1 Tax=Comamonas sp. BIGb0152 TaxID=2940601 RepID=UPI002169D46E|nr:TssQ family T6SS-associated lipoprotein [Comamonas sp. BIGb0152]MCS4292944.1 Flp pilus assembly protein TadD [Comamonas sp. BIGb0152]
MTMNAFFLKKSLMVSMAIALAACASSENNNDPEPSAIPASAELEVVAPPPPESRAAQVSDQVNTTGLTAVERRFSEGLALYNDGRYANAIRIFREPVFTRAWPELRMRSLKYLAFSYCVTGKAAQCQKSFEEILKLDAAFELSSAEQGHPLWDPVFQQAKAKVDATVR